MDNVDGSINSKVRDHPYDFPPLLDSNSTHKTQLALNALYAMPHPMHQTTLTTANPKPRRRSFIFNEKWLLPLGLQITHRDPDNKKIVTISCRSVKPMVSKSQTIEQKVTSQYQR